MLDAMWLVRFVNEDFDPRGCCDEEDNGVCEESCPVIVIQQAVIRNFLGE